MNDINSHDKRGRKIMQRNVWKLFRNCIDRRSWMAEWESTNQRQHGKFKTLVPTYHSSFPCLNISSVKIDDVDHPTLMTLTNVSVDVTALFHLGGAIWALDSRFFAALELYMPLQVPRVYITFRALRTNVSPRRRLERLIMFVVKILQFL